MKHLNFLSNLLSLSLGSPCTDVSLDRRLTVGSPSGRYCSGLMRLVFILAILLTVGVGNVWGASTTGTIVFSSATEGNGKMKLDATPDTGKDTQGNTWNFSTTSSYFGPNSSYYQVGSNNNIAGTIEFSMTLASDVSFTAFSAKFQGVSNKSDQTASLKIDGTAVASATISGSSTITPSYTTATTGKTLTVTLTGTAGGVKCYNISYTYEPVASCSNSVAVTKGSESHGEVTTIGSASVATCSSTESDRRVTITITPDDCYDAPTNLTWTKSSGTVTASKQSGPTDNGDGTYSYVYQFAQNDNGAGTFGVTCTAKAAGKTVNFDAGPGSCLTSSLTETCDGSGVTLPNVTASGVCKGWSTFAGWATAAVSDSTTTSGVTLYAAGDNFVPSSNGQTLYAVYSKNKGGGSASTSTLTNSSIVSSGNSNGYKTYCTSDCNKSPIDGWSGKFAVNYVSSGTHYSVQLGRATTSSASAYNTHLTSPTYASGATHISLTLSTSANQVTANGRKFYLMDTDELNYTAADQTSSYGVGTYDNSDDNYEVSFDVTGSPTQFHIYADGIAYIKTITVTYGGSTTYYCSDPNCCTPLGSINGSFF